HIPALLIFQAEDDQAEDGFYEYQRQNKQWNQKQQEHPRMPVSCSQHGWDDHRYDEPEHGDEQDGPASEGPDEEQVTVKVGRCPEDACARFVARWRPGIVRDAQQALARAADSAIHGPEVRDCVGWIALRAGVGCGPRSVPASFAVRREYRRAERAFQLR